MLGKVLEHLFVLLVITGCRCCYSYQ